ncbi:MAG: rhodanese-like domain-containing protein, partial [Deltaproteobacteria bacterium]|nr:rhodanese-like domain-containing protein [Deltaproteobacteria bacterium]
MVRKPVVLRRCFGGKSGNWKTVVLISLLLLACPRPSQAQFSLWLVEKRLDLKYPVNHMKHEVLAEALASNRDSDFLLFDIRAREEYDVSRIDGAVWVDPEMSEEEFIKTYGGAVKGKHLVFYCSVGDRSSRFLMQVLDPALAAGALSLSNLRGGIFRWVNEDHPVVNQNGKTDAV